MRATFLNVCRNKDLKNLNKIYLETKKIHFEVFLNDSKTELSKTENSKLILSRLGRLGSNGTFIRKLKLWIT